MGGECARQFASMKNNSNIGYPSIDTVVLPGIQRRNPGEFVLAFGRVPTRLVKRKILVTTAQELGHETDPS